MEDILLKCELDKVKQFVGIARRLWLRWNEVVHEGHITHPNDLVLRTKTAMEEFTKVTTRAENT